MVVFDRKSNKAHLLDARAAAVFRASADGALMSDLEPLMGEFADAKRTALAALAVKELERVGLVVTSGEVETGMSRRAILKSLGSAATLPLVVSIVAPTPAAAASNLPPGAACTSDAECSGPVCGAGCMCQPVGSGGSTTKCCIGGEGAIGAACANDNQCCAPDLACSSPGMQCCQVAGAMLCA